MANSEISVQFNHPMFKNIVILYTVVKVKKGYNLS